MWWNTLAFAGSVSFPEPPVAEPPLVGSVAVRWGFTGDLDRDAIVAVRYRVDGATGWTPALPLQRVDPGAEGQREFAGMVFGLIPGLPWEVELAALDPDGGSTVATVQTSTRREPLEPLDPETVRVGTQDALESALLLAKPGQSIELASATFVGPFFLPASGDPDRPIVVRSAPGAAAVLSGGACDDCAVLTVQGSSVRVESLTLTGGAVGLAFAGDGLADDVARDLTISAVGWGILAGPTALGFTVCDNTVQGLVPWPNVREDDGGAYEGLAGIAIGGSGHTVAHNAVADFPSGIVLEAGTRDTEVVGNEVRSSYDAGIVLDQAAGNLLVAYNRLTNVDDALSFSPLTGGPAYAVRNLAVNVADEQLRLHSAGWADPTGMRVYRNTFVSSGRAVTLFDTGTSRDFEVVGNVFVGSADAPYALEWSPSIERGVIEGDGWFPDGPFWWYPLGEWNDLEDLALAGPFEHDGVALLFPPLASGVEAPDDWTIALEPTSPVLRADSPAVDAGSALPNVDDGFHGAAPDLGAQELGCAEYPYGPRADGVGWLRGGCADGESGIDADGDGLGDDVEAGIGTDPANPDTDGDGLTDGEEGIVDHDGDGRLDPLDPDDDDDTLDTLAEGHADLDGDGHPNHLDLDSDGDGASDRAEGLPDALDAGGSLGSPPQATFGCGCGTTARPGVWVLVLALAAAQRGGGRVRGGSREARLPHQGGSAADPGKPHCRTRADLL